MTRRRLRPVRRPRRRRLRRLLLGATLAFILAVVVREPSLPPSPTRLIQNAQVTHGPGLIPVLADTRGPCPANHPPTMIWAATYDTCLALGDRDGLHVTSVKTIQIVQDDAFWSVRLELTTPDAASLARLTKTLVSNPSPRNELAIVLHGPPGGLVLSAPVVTESIGHLEIAAGPTQASAPALRDAILQ